MISRDEATNNFTVRDHSTVIRINREKHRSATDISVGLSCGTVEGPEKIEEAL